MDRKVAFLTNAREYAGPPTGLALAELGWTVFSHDDSFTTEDARTSYEQGHPNLIASDALGVTAFAEAGLARFGRVDAVISNDIPKQTTAFFDLDDHLIEFEKHVESLLLEPVRFLRPLLPTLKASKSGSVVLVTSGAPIRNPAMGGPHGYTAARAGAHGLVKALAAELAPHGVQVNAVAPFFVYSETFFASDLREKDPAFEPIINQMVPMKRFGDPAEIGALIAFLASGTATFVSGQVIAFSGAGC